MKKSSFVRAFPHRAAVLFLCHLSAEQTNAKDDHANCSYSFANSHRASLLSFCLLLIIISAQSHCYYCTSAADNCRTSEKDQKRCHFQITPLSFISAWKSPGSVFAFVSSLHQTCRNSYHCTKNHCCEYHFCFLLLFCFVVFLSVII